MVIGPLKEICSNMICSCEQDEYSYSCDHCRLLLNNFKKEKPVAEALEFYYHDIPENFSKNFEEHREAYDKAKKLLGSIKKYYYEDMPTPDIIKMRVKLESI